MRVPLEWLGELVELDGPPETVAEQLTFAGIEVEGLERVGSNFEGVVVGKVRAVERHPNADRLTVCRVWDGTSERAVVCGAPNVRPGGCYPLALPDCTLPNGMTVRPTRIRGVESAGMLCAEDELGLSSDHSGLLELPEDATPGAPLRAILGGPDIVLDLEITPNRPDCLSLLGIARELAAIRRRPLKPLPLDLPAAGGPPSVAEAVRVTVEAPDLCPRYTARLIRGVRIAPSPRWMQIRLSRAGLRPICNVVDVTNYVLLEMGQPLHAFDLARLAGPEIRVRRAAEGELIRTLDGVDRELDPSILVIADAVRPVAVAGVMGGEGSEVSDPTSDILLESACFHPPAIRAAARRLGLSTESSHRFARGVDPELAEVASRRAASLLVALAGGAIAPGAVDLYPTPARPRRIVCRPSAVRDRTGLNAPAGEVADVLRALGLEVSETSDPDRLNVTVPTRRADLEGEIDLVEEFARIHGLDRVPAAVPSARIVPGVDDVRYRAAERVREVFCALGLIEVMNYSLTSGRLLDLFGFDSPADRIRLPNPISVEQAVLRTSLLPQMVETLGRNRARQVDDAALVEFGRVFRATPDGGSAEVERVAVGLMGSAGRGPLARRPPPTPEESFSWLRGLLEAAAAAVRAPAPEFVPADARAFEPGHALEIRLAGAPAGRAGILRRDLAAEWRIHEPVALAEFDLEPLTAGWGIAPTPPLPPSHPCAVRDLAFIMDRAVRNEQVLEVILRVASPELERVALFDVYEGRGIPAGRKSMAYSLTYRGAGRTITDDEIQRAQQRIAEAVMRELGAVLRADPAGGPNG